MSAETFAFATSGMFTPKDTPPDPNTKPEDRTIDEVYSGLRRQEMQNQLRPFGGALSGDSSLFASRWEDSKAYQQEKDYVTTMLADPDNLGGVAPNIVKASQSHPDGQNLKDMSVAIRATAFMLNRKVDEIDPTQFPIYMKGVASQLGKPTPKTVSAYRSMLAEHFTGMKKREDAFTDLTQKLVSDQLFSASTPDQSPAAKDVGRTLAVWFSEHPEIAEDSSKHWLIARSANQLSQNMVKELEPVKAPAARTFQTLVKFTQGAIEPDELSDLAASLTKLSPDDRQKVYRYTSIAAQANQIDRSVLSQFAVNMGQSFSRGFDFIPQTVLRDREAGVADWVESIKNKVQVWVPMDGDLSKASVGNAPDSAMREIMQEGQWRLAMPSERQTLVKSGENALKAFQIERELKNIASSSVDPIRQLSNGGLLGQVERGAYGLSGSIPLMGATALNPIIGTMSYQASFYDKLRLTNPDMSMKAANGLAVIEGAANMFIDKLQLSALAGNSVFFARTLQSMKGGGIVNYLKRAGLIQGEQFLQENIQDLIPPVVEGIAAAIRQDMPNTDFAKDMKDYFTTRPEVFFAVLPLALVGGGFASVNAVKNPAATFTREAMRMAGFSEQSIEHVFSSKDNEQLQQRLQEEWKKRSPEDINKGIELAERQAEGAKAFQSPYALAIDETADGDSTFVVTDKRDGTEVLRTKDLDAAWEIIGQRQAADLVNEKQSILELVNWATRILEDPSVTLDAAPKEVKDAMKQYEQAGEQEMLRDLRRRLVDAGFDPDGDLTGVQIFGETSIEQVRDAVYRAVIVLRQNSNPLDAFEEIGHGFDKIALSEGRVTLDQFSKWLEQTEASTGIKLNRGNSTEILESMARVRQDWLSGKLDDAALPFSFVAYLKKLAAVLQDAILRFAKIQAAVESGGIDKSFSEYLDESLGISPQSKMDRIADEQSGALVQGAAGQSYSIRATDPYPDREKNPGAPLTETEILEEVEGEPGLTADIEIDPNIWETLDDEAKQQTTYSIRKGAPKEAKIPGIHYNKLKGKNVFVYFADRMRVGEYRGLDPKSGIRIPLQGGPSYPFTLGNIDSDAGWAFTDEGSVFTTFSKRVRDTDGIGVVCLFTKGNIRGNKTFLKAYIAEVEWAIASGKLDKALWLQEANRIRNATLNKSKDGATIGDGEAEWIPLWKEEWKSLSQAEQALANATYDIRSGSFFGYEPTKKGQKGAIIGATKLVEQGFPNIDDMITAMEDPRFSNLDYGDMVAAVQFDQNDTTPHRAKDINVKQHMSYDVIIKGKGIGFFTKPKNVLQVISTNKPRAAALRSLSMSMPQTTFSVGKRRFGSAASNALFDDVYTTNESVPWDMPETPIDVTQANGKTARELLQMIPQQSVFHFIAQQLSKLPFAQLDTDKAKVVFDRKTGARSNYGGTILLPWDRALPRSVVHEVMHSLTADYIDKITLPFPGMREARGAYYLRNLEQLSALKSTPKPAKDLIKLYLGTIDALGVRKELFGRDNKTGGPGTTAAFNLINKGKKKTLTDKATGEKYNAQQLYGLSNLDEFVAQAMTDGTFQQLLASIPAVEGVDPNSNVSMWDKFVEIFRNLLKSWGIDIDGSVLGQVLSVTGNIASEQMLSPFDENGNQRRIKADDDVDELIAATKGEYEGDYTLERLVELQRKYDDPENWSESVTEREVVTELRWIIDDAPAGYFPESLDTAVDDAIADMEEEYREWGGRSDIPSMDKVVNEFMAFTDSKKAAAEKSYSIRKEGLPPVTGMEIDQLLKEYEENQGYLGLSTLGMREGRTIRGAKKETKRLLARNSEITQELASRGYKEEDPQLKSALEARGLYSIRRVQQSGIEAQLDNMKRGPEERLALYSRAKEQFLDVLNRNSQIVEDAIASGATPQATRKLQLQQAIGELEAIFRVLPVSVRARLGGFAKLANIAPMDVFKDGTKVSEAKNRAGAYISAWMREGDSIGVAMRRTELPPGYSMEENFDSDRTDKALAQFFKERVSMIDRALERILRREYEVELQNIWKRTKPKKDQPGERPKGIGAEVQRMFAELKDIAEMSEEEVSAKITGIQHTVDSGNLSPEEEAYQRQLMGLSNLVGNWRQADADRRASAVAALRDTWTAAYANFKIKKIREAARLRDLQDTAAIATGKTGENFFDRSDKDRETSSGWGRFNSLIHNVLSWDGVVRLVFGDKSPISDQFSDMQREADNDKQDGIDAAMQEVEDLFVAMTGSRAKGEMLRYEMTKPSITTKKGKLSQLQALTATMMWMQEDGKRHMTGHLDTDGAPNGKWHYDQNWVDSVENQLTPEARRIRRFLLQRYASGWYPLNKVYSDLNGVNLPQIANYSPMSLLPINANNANVDALTGQPLGGSVNFGSLMNRGTSIAEPDFKDALSVYLAHVSASEHFKAYAPFMHEIGRVIKNRDVQNAVKEAFGPEAATVLNSWMTQLAQGGNRDASIALGLNKLVSEVLGRTTQMALVGRIGTLLVQTTQLAAASAEMPMGAYFNRLSKLLTGNLDWSSAFKSEFIQRRIKQMPPVVQEAMRGLQAKKPSAVKRAVRTLGNLISGADALFTAGTYAILYDYHLDQGQRVLGMNTKQAEEHASATAERITDRLAQPTRMGAKSIYELTVSNPAGRIMMSFISEPRKNLGLWVYSLANRPAKEKLRTTMYVWVASALMSTLIRTAWRDARDSDDDEILDGKNWDISRLMMMWFTDPLTGIPLFGEALQQGIYALTGEYTPKGDLLSMENGARALSHIDDIFAGDRNVEETLKDVNGILSLAGMANQNIAAIASLSTIAKDVFGLTKNTAKTVTE